MACTPCIFKCAKLNGLADRRKELIERLASQRHQISVIYQQLERPFHWVDYGISAGRFFNKAPFALTLLAPIVMKLFSKRFGFVRKASDLSLRFLEIWGIVKQASRFFSNRQS